MRYGGTRTVPPIFFGVGIVGESVIGSPLGMRPRLRLRLGCEPSRLARLALKDLRTRAIEQSDEEFPVPPMELAALANRAAADAGALTADQDPAVTVYEPLGNLADC